MEKLNVHKDNPWPKLFKKITYQEVKTETIEICSQSEFDQLLMDIRNEMEESDMKLDIKITLINNN